MLIDETLFIPRSPSLLEELNELEKKKNLELETKIKDYEAQLQMQIFIFLKTFKVNFNCYRNEQVEIESLQLANNQLRINVRELTDLRKSDQK